MSAAMTAHLFAISFDASEPLRLAQFWAGLLGREIADDPHDGVLLLPADDNEYHLRFAPNQQPKVVQNRMHFDLTSSSLEDQRQTVARALELGARHADIGQGPEIDHVVLADPEGNEFDVIAPGNRFLAGCGFVGALACDGSQAVGYFWSAALGWPLVWDQDEETAIQSPHGGTKFTWGGPPYDAERRPGSGAVRPRSGCRRRPADRGRPSALARSDPGRHRPGRGRPVGAGRPRWSGVQPADAPLAARQRPRTRRPVGQRRHRSVRVIRREIPAYRWSRRDPATPAHRLRRVRRRRAAQSGPAPPLVGRAGQPGGVRAAICAGSVAATAPAT